MRDHYTCICGSVEWIISNNCIECASCGFKYTMFAIISADDFGKRIRKGFIEKEINRNKKTIWRTQNTTEYNKKGEIKCK